MSVVLWPFISRFSTPLDCTGQSVSKSEVKARVADSPTSTDGLESHVVRRVVMRVVWVVRDTVSVGVRDAFWRTVRARRTVGG